MFRSQIRAASSYSAKDDLPLFVSRRDYSAGIDTRKHAQSIGENQATVLTNQAVKITSEKTLLDQKTETEIAQTNNTADGNVIWDPATKAAIGVIGEQRGLYEAQREGFARDADRLLTPTA